MRCGLYRCPPARRSRFPGARAGRRSAMRSTARLLPSALVVALALTLGAARSPAQTLSTGAAICQQTIGSGGQAFKKAKLKAWQKCLDGMLLGNGCDASGRDAKIATAAQKATAKNC